MTRRFFKAFTRRNPDGSYTPSMDYSYHLGEWATMPAHQVHIYSSGFHFSTNPFDALSMVIYSRFLGLVEVGGLVDVRPDHNVGVASSMRLVTVWSFDQYQPVLDHLVEDFLTTCERWRQTPYWTAFANSCLSLRPGSEELLRYETSVSTSHQFQWHIKDMLGDRFLNIMGGIQ